MRHVIPSLLALSVAAASPAAALAASADIACSALAANVIGDAKVEAAEAVTSGSFQPAEGAALAGLPAFCHVRGLAKPAARSDIHFEVWLPLADWNGRIQMVGNGGYSPAMNFAQLAALLKSGSVAVATDTGHTGPADDLSFGDDNDD